MYQNFHYLHTLPEFFTMVDNSNVTNLIHKKIRGPINVLRLEGNISGIAKIIYIFMDYHEYPKCSANSADIVAEDIDEYLENILSNLNRKKTLCYDFFMEITLKDIISKNFKFEGLYINKLRLLFMKLFSYDFDEKEMKIKNVKTKNLEKIRLHYVDIRDYINFDIFTNYMNIITIMKNIISVLNIPNLDILTSNEVDNIVDYYIALANNFTVFSKQIKKLYGVLTKNFVKKPITKHYTDLSNYLLEYIIYKIKYMYENNLVKSKLNEVLEELSKNLYTLLNNSKHVSKIMNENLESIVKKIISGHDILVDFVWKIKESIDLCIPIIDNFLTYSSYFMDVYLLRRFLEKKYITNVIVYVGCEHGANCIDILVKKFNFKITNACYFNVANIDDLNSNILNSSSRTDVVNLTIPKLKNQIVDLYGFPEPF
ncbi:MAG: hypothetical protein QXW79_01590 [Thermoplasmata archaeon]